MREYKYILDVDGNPVPCEDVVAWGEWMEDAERRVINSVHPKTGVRVSTVFLGIDHGWDDRKPPLLWETMVFGGPSNGTMNRYSTLAEAQDGHRQMVALVFGYPALPDRVTDQLEDEHD